MPIETLMNKCNDLLKKNKYSEVIKICNQILEKDSNNEFALRIAGTSNYHLKNYKESEKYLEKAYNINPTDKKIIECYGITLLEVEKLDKALTLYDFYFNSKEKSRKYEVEQYYVNLSKRYSHQNKTKNALKCYDYYLNKETDSIMILKSKIELLSHLKRFDDALECYDLLIDSSDDGKMYTRSRIDQIFCLEAKAFYLYDKQLLKESIDTLSIASDYYLNKYDLDLEDELTAWHKHLSKTLSKYEDNPEEFFDKLFYVDKEDSMAWTTLIKYFTSRYDSYGDIDIMLCDWLLENNPNSIPILNKKAELHRNWKPTLSLKLYEKILEVEEDNLDAIKGKLEMLNNLKWHGKAYNYIKTLPNNINGISDEISNMAKGLTENGKYTEAIELYEKILESNPSDVSPISDIKKILDKKEMKEVKKNSKYYMDWINVILSHKINWCSEDECYDRLSQVMPGLNKHVIIDKLDDTKDLIIKGYIDCDDDTTHYCLSCKKEYKFDVECFEYNKEDEILYNYAKTLILAVKHKLFWSGEKIEYLQNSLYSDYHIDKREFNALINKLEKLGYLSRKVTLNEY